MPEDASNTVVSVTPIAIERDSRTMKQAATLARLGYRSVVVEGEASEIDGAKLPFELTTAEGAAPTWDSGRAAPGELQQTAGGKLDALRLEFLAWSRMRLWRLRSYLRQNRLAYRALPAADLYVVHSYFLYPAVAFKVLRRRGARYVYDAHDLYFELRPSQRSPDREQRIWQLVERLCVRFAAAFTTATAGNAEALAGKYGRRPVTIRNSHDLRLDEVVQTGLRERVGLGEDDFLAVFVGNDKDGATTDEALVALSLLPDRVHLACVGRGHEGHQPHARELGLADRFHPVGSVPPTQVTDFIASADAAMVLYRPLTRNYANALPNGFFHALAAGLPVIYPEALPEVVAVAERHELGLAVDSGSPESIAEALAALADDPERAGRFAANAAAARESESWEHEERVLADVVAGALRRS